MCKSDGEAFSYLLLRISECLENVLRLHWVPMGRLQLGFTVSSLLVTGVPVSSRNKVLLG